MGKNSPSIACFLYYFQPNSDVVILMVSPVNPQVQNEYEPDSPRVIAAVPHRNARDIVSDFPSCFPYDESPTAGLALKSAAASPASTHSAHSTIEATAFVRDALDEVVSDFERTLERTKKKSKIKLSDTDWKNRYFDPAGEIINVFQVYCA